jgi:hypothetical protein
MDAQLVIVPFLAGFAECFSRPGFMHFQLFVLAHMGLMGMPHCVSEVMRLMGSHEQWHWTTPYSFMKAGRFSCRALSQKLLELVLGRLGMPEEPKELVIGVDDTLVKKVGKHFFGLGYYPDPTDKNPGGNKRKVLGHCWVVLALLVEIGGVWFGFPLAALLFVPLLACSKKWKFMSKVELAAFLIQRFRWPAKRLILLVDNLYAKGKLAFDLGLSQEVVMVSRLRSNAALYELPKKPKKPKAGRPRLRGDKLTVKQLYRRRSKHQQLKVNIYGKSLTIKAFVAILMPSPTLGSQPIQVIIFPQRSDKLNIFFSTDLNMSPVRILELYAARFKIEDIFDEIKTTGGFADCRQRSFPALKRHATLTLLAYSLLRLLSITLPNAHTIETVPWWKPKGPPSVTRLRRAVLKSLNISHGLPFYPKQANFTNTNLAA